MLRRKTLVLLIAGFASASTRLPAADRPPADRPPATLAFALPNAEPGANAESSLATVEPGQARLTVVCFLGVECPLAKLYAGRLSKLAARHAEQGVRFVGVNSNSQDSAADVATYVAQHGISFPVVKDFGNTVADAYGARRTPHVFVLDEGLRIRYDGRIDDQFEPGVARPAPDRRDLADAIQQLLNGEPVRERQTDAVGCLIGRVKRPVLDSKITYTRQVSRVLQRHCVECHREGEIGPFALTEYDEVAGWAEMLVEVVDDGRMPPWHATDQHAEFANARFMSEEDKQILRDWVAAGAPYGDPRQLPEPAEFVAGWNLPRSPDLVVPMGDRPFTVPADGTVEYQYFVVDPGFEEDTWVTSAQVIPGNRSVVHHAIVFIRPPDGERFRGMGWLQAYVPGQRAMPYEKNRGRRIPANSRLVFQMHYTPTGTEQTDMTRIGILFGNDAEITHEVYTVVGIDQQFEIPPFADSVRVSGDVPGYPRNGHLLAIGPHMHLRGKSFRCSIERGGQQTTLLEVPRYDFNWQHSYQLSEPLPLADIDALDFDMTFDNSAGNPFNPDPAQYVTWGDQTWEEMAVAFFDVAEPREAASPSDAPGVEPVTAATTEQQAVVDRRAAEKTDRFFARFDTNRNAVVEKSETPFAVQAFAFWRYDMNRDGALTREEVLSAVQQRLD